MNRKSFNIIIASLFVSAQFCPASAKDKAAAALEIYLPREITIKNDSPVLGQVSIIRGEEPLVAKASNITLGQLCVPGQELIIDRQTVLSRLACNGIAVSKVTLTGAEKTTVTQQHQIIEGGKFVEAASRLLGENLPEPSIRQWEPTVKPKDLVLPKICKKIKLLAHLVKTEKGRAKVQVAAIADGKQIDSRAVTFRLKYNYRRAVALSEIAGGSVLSPENIKIEETLSSYPEPADWQAPYGLVTKRRIPENKVILPNMVTIPKPKVLLGRNKTVVIRIDKGQLLVTAMGKTMQKGCAGEYIKVRNIDSQRIIVAKVNEDGTVEPVF